MGRHASNDGRGGGGTHDAEIPYGLADVGAEFCIEGEEDLIRVRVRFRVRFRVRLVIGGQTLPSQSGVVSLTKLTAS